MVFSVSVLLSEGENELVCDKDFLIYTGLMMMNPDYMLLRNKVKDLEMDPEIPPTLSGSPSSYHHPPVA